MDKKLMNQLREHQQKKERAKHLRRMVVAGVMVLIGMWLLTGCTAARADAIARFMFWPKLSCDAYIDGNPGSCINVVDGRLYNGQSTK